MFRSFRLIAFAAILPFAALSADWKPIDPAQLALKTPKIDPHADAEAILWEVRMRDEFQGDDPQTVLIHYLRIKIYTGKGRDEHSKVDLIYTGSSSIMEISGRTIKPDGAIVELKKDAIFDRSLIKTSGLKVKTKSFAMPAVEPGAIIEYQWREIRNKQLINYSRLHFQRDIPIWSVKYHIKPLENSGAAGYLMRTQAFQCKPAKFEAEPDGYFRRARKRNKRPGCRARCRMLPGRSRWRS